jgi:hypothetical protein
MRHAATRSGARYDHGERNRAQVATDIVALNLLERFPSSTDVGEEFIARVLQVRFALILVLVAAARKPHFPQSDGGGSPLRVAAFDDEAHVAPPRPRTEDEDLGF